MSLKEVTQRKKEYKDALASQSTQKIPKKSVFVGVYGGEHDLYDALVSGCAQYGKELHLQRVTKDSGDEVWGALDIVLLLDGLDQGQGIWEYCQLHAIVPIVWEKSGWTSLVKEYEPTKEQGNGFYFSAYNAWSLFAVLIRALETKRFSYDWNTLLKRIHTS
jgi:hypothetical protein